jgi:hypothetical protein
MRCGRGVGGELAPECGQTALFGNVAEGARARDQDRDEVRRGGAGDEQTAGSIREPEDLLRPRQDLPLNLNGHVVPPTHIRVHACRQHLGQHADGSATALYPAHEAGMRVAAGVGEDRLEKLGVYRGKLGRRGRQCFAKSGNRVARRRLP